MVSDDKVQSAYRALRADGDIQFDMAKAPPPEKPPEWLIRFFKWLGDVLEPVGRFFAWINGLLPDAPYARIFFWAMIAVIVLLLAWIVWDRFRHGIWRLPRFARRAPVLPGDLTQGEDDWRPDAAPAREWLQEADALAAKGQFAQAVHHLLLRSVQDLSQRRPQIVRPAATSRELAMADGIPFAPRRLFAQIATVVERSFFGGRDVSEADWGLCRAAYADFAQTKSWGLGASVPA
jgi:hypothetical protein